MSRFFTNCSTNLFLLASTLTCCFSVSSPFSISSLRLTILSTVSFTSGPTTISLPFLIVLVPAVIKPPAIASLTKASLASKPVGSTILPSSWIPCLAIVSAVVDVRPEVPSIAAGTAIAAKGLTTLATSGLLIPISLTHLFKLGILPVIALTPNFSTAVLITAKELSNAKSAPSGNLPFISWYSRLKFS